VGDVFKALADPTRRAILDELNDRNGQTLFEICARLASKHGFASTRQAISQHLDVLEEAGLVRTEKIGRVRTCRLGPRRMADEVAWILRYQEMLDARLDSLERYLERTKGD